jgi:hypothetical protein
VPPLPGRAHPHTAQPEASRATALVLDHGAQEYPGPHVLLSGERLNRLPQKPVRRLPAHRRATRLPPAEVSDAPTLPSGEQADRLLQESAARLPCGGEERSWLFS